MASEQPCGYWVFSVRVGTSKVRTPTKKMQEKIAKRISKIAGVYVVQVEEDFTKDPLKPFKPMMLVTPSSPNVYGPDGTRKLVDSDSTENT